MSDDHPRVRQYRPLAGTGGLTLRYCECRAGPDDAVYEEQHLVCSISLVERGVFTYRNGTDSNVLGPGWIMLGNAGDSYVCSHEYNDGNGDDGFVLAFPAETYDALLSAAGGTHGVLAHTSLPPLPRVAALFRLLARDGAEGFAFEETTLALIAALQSELAGTNPAAAPLQGDRALAAARYIETHATAALSVEDVAREVGMSPFHFLRSFRRAIGVTPHQYLLRMRTLHAIALLRDTALPVTEIAFRSGWADLSNFIRTFHRAVGCSPRDFRRGRLPLELPPALC